MGDIEGENLGRGSIRYLIFRRRISDRIIVVPCASRGYGAETPSKQPMVKEAYDPYDKRVWIRIIGYVKKRYGLKIGVCSQDWMNRERYATYT
jgi:hypothetical protein